MSASTSKPDFTAAIERLREIANQSHDNALTEGPVNADRLLLELCAEITHGLKLRNLAWDRRRALPAAAFMAKTRDEAIAVDEARRTSDRADKNYSAMLRAAAKIKATTAAGIYAKAMAVRASTTGAANLAMSLAEDLLDCPGLRASLWPAQEGE
jgi:hypothetical protein